MAKSLTRFKISSEIETIFYTIKKSTQLNLTEYYGVSCIRWVEHDPLLGASKSTLQYSTLHLDEHISV